MPGKDQQLEEPEVLAKLAQESLCRKVAYDKGKGVFYCMIKYDSFTIITTMDKNTVPFEVPFATGRVGLGNLKFPK